MRFAVFFFFLCLVPLPSMAAEAVSGDEIKFDDGKIVRLLGIKAADDQAQTTLQALIEHQELIVENGALDRYGRIAADIYAPPETGQKVLIQGALLQAGLAFVYPPTGTEPHLAELYKLETTARRTRHGIWSEAAYADLPANEEKKIPYGKFAFVSGKVMKAERIKNMFYLNFGEDWRTDFTIAIAAHDLRLFRKADIDPDTYKGKTVRVRGWVKRNFGPMIMATHPSQIEVLGETPAKP
jgi:hypothetical protein